MKKTTLAITVSAVLGVTVIEPVSAIGLADGFYDMVINNTPYSSGYDVGTDGAWNSSFVIGSLPGSKGGSTQGMYDDTIAQPVNGKYSGVANDGVAGTIGIQVSGGVITGTGKFEFDTIINTALGSFAEYGNSSGFTGSIDASGNVSLTPTGVLATPGDFPSLVDERWNVDNFNSYSGTTFTPNPPSDNTAYDVFSTGTDATGSINGAAYDGTTAVLVKGGRLGSDWLGSTGVFYYETWNVSFTPTTVPIPAAIWLFGSGLIGLSGIARIRKR